MFGGRSLNRLLRTKYLIKEVLINCGGLNVR